MSTVWIREETEEPVIEPWNEQPGQGWKEYGMRVWIRRGFRWVERDLTDVPAGQYYVTEPPTEALAVAQADQVAEAMAADPPGENVPVPPGEGAMHEAVDEPMTMGSPATEAKPDAKAPPRRKKRGSV